MKKRKKMTTTPAEAVPVFNTLSPIFSVSPRLCALRDTVLPDMKPAA
jgi:hypothetical protein